MDIALKPPTDQLFTIKAQVATQSIHGLFGSAVVTPIWFGKPAVNASIDPFDPASRCYREVSRKKIEKIAQFQHKN